MNKYHIYVLTLILTTLLLAACGGGGGGGGGGSSNSTAVLDPGSSSPPDSSGVLDENQETGVTSTGIITGFGSVFVNGVEFETDGASISTDDDPNASEDDLEVGMVVWLKGTINEDGVTGEASDIEYEEELQGFVESIDLAGESFTVLGQQISIDGLTNFENVTFDTLQTGQLVEVSGMVNAEGTILASLVKLEDVADESNQEQKVTGNIQNYDADNSRFEINGLIIDFSTADFENGSQEDLGDDVYVRVKSSRDLVDGVFQADMIVFKGPGEHSAEEGDPMLVDGIIDSFESPENFTVSGYRALVNDETEYLSGSTVDDLAINQRLRIKGFLNSEGVIVIAQLTLQTRNFLGMEGEIEVIDPFGKTVTMLGITFQVNENTHFIDSGAGRIRHFGLSDLLVGDWIEIKAEETDEATQYIAVKIKRHHDKDPDQIKLSGPITGIDAEQGSFVIHGFTVQVVGETEIGIDHGDDLDAIAFFELLAEGSVVKVVGHADGDLVIADEVRVKKVKDSDKGNSGKNDEVDSQGKGNNGNGNEGKGCEKSGGNGKGNDKGNDDGCEGSEEEGSEEDSG